MVSSSQEKRQVFEGMLELGKTMLHFDPRRFGVDVPRHLAGRVSLQLDFSRRFHLDVFTITERAVSASLSFGGQDYLCKIPWSAVFGIFCHANSQIALWPEDAPEELQAKAKKDALPTPDAALDDASGDRGDGNAADESDHAESEPDDAFEPIQIGSAVRRISHLRVVK